MFPQCSHNSTAEPQSVNLIQGFQPLGEGPGPPASPAILLSTLPVRDEAAGGLQTPCSAQRADKRKPGL